MSVFAVQWVDPDTLCPSSRFYDTHEEAEALRRDLNRRHIPAYVVQMEVQP